MQKDMLVSSFEQIKVIAEQALRGRHASKSRPSTPKPGVRLAGKNDLPSQILGLRDKGFFRPPRTANETHAKLQSIYPCDLNGVAVAMLRLQKRKLLRKTSKVVGKKSSVAYGW